MLKTNLSNVPVDYITFIESIQLPKAEKNRVQSMGLRKGCQVRVLSEMLFTLRVLVNNTFQIILDKSLAKSIVVAKT